MNGISVVICTYNGGTKLENTINHISKQEDNSLPFELIIVDNNSNDNTSKLAKMYCQQFRIVDYSIISEAKPGKTYALTTGFKNAKFDILITCDDDNWLNCHFFKHAISGFKKYPNAAILGAWCIPSFDINKKVPQWFQNVVTSYAVGGEPNHDIKSLNVWGAGMCLKRSVALKIFEQPFLSTCRIGNALISGGDDEICEKTLELGFDIYKLKHLHFTHYIPSSRLTWSYVTRLYEGFGYGDMQRSLLTYNKSFLRLYTGYSLLNFKKILKFPLPFLFFLINKKGAISALPFYRILGCYKYLHSKK